MKTFVTMRTIETSLMKMLSTSMKKLTVSVEGNIGSGKSTVLSHLGRISACDIVDEPVESWTNLRGNNLLAMLYDDPKRWAFAFQANAQMTLARLHSQTAKSPIKIMERSIHSARHCFVENLYQKKILQEVEFEILKNWYEMLVANNSCRVDLIIYLRAAPEICLERIRIRNRPEEKTISLDYLKDLHRHHEEWLFSSKLPSDVSLLVVDADRNKEEVFHQTNERLCQYATC